MRINQNVEGRLPQDKTAEPTIIGFTPINGTKVIRPANMSDGVDEGDGIPTLDPKLSPSTIRRKRKQIQVLDLTVAEEKTVEPSKPKSVPRSSKKRNFIDQRISRGLKTTKPVLPRAAKSSQKAPSFSSIETFLEGRIPNSEILTTFVQDDKLNVPFSELRPVLSGLGDQYQAAYLEERTENVVGSASEPLSHAKIPVSAYSDLSKTCVEMTERNYALFPASVQSLRSPACEPETFQDSLQVIWNHDDFPMDDDGIQEMMTLTEFKQSTSNLAFRRHSDCPGLSDEENRGDLVWLKESFCLDNVYKDDEDLQKLSPSSSTISNLTQSAGLSSTNRTAQGEMNDEAALDYADNSFDDDGLDFELMEMLEPLCEIGLTSFPLTKSSRPYYGNLRSAAVNIDNVENTLEPPKLPKEIPWMISFDAEGKPIPFIRPSFPKAIRDRSPILGLTTRIALKTCFRIGEALNVASAASRSKVDAIIELFARVDSSERELGSFKQSFQFSDIFSPEKPPFLAGTYGLWRGVALWDNDSKAFLGEQGRGKMARALGRLKRETQSQKWEMTILSIWPVGLDDVGIAKGIILS